MRESFRKRFSRNSVISDEGDNTNNPWSDESPNEKKASVFGHQRSKSSAEKRSSLETGSVRSNVSGTTIGESLSNDSKESGLGHIKENVLATTPRLELPNPIDGNGTITPILTPTTPKAHRRRKTLTKEPGFFQLVDDDTPALPASSPLLGPTDLLNKPPLPPFGFALNANALKRPLLSFTPIKTLGQTDPTTQVPPQPRAFTRIIPFIIQPPREPPAKSDKKIGKIVPFIVQPPREPPVNLDKKISHIIPHIIQPPREPPSDSPNATDSAFSQNVQSSQESLEKLAKSISKVSPYIVQPPRDPPKPLPNTISGPIPYVVQPPREPQESPIKSVSGLLPHVDLEPIVPPSTPPHAISELLPHLDHQPIDPPEPVLEPAKTISGLYAHIDQHPVDHPAPESTVIERETPDASPRTISALLPHFDHSPIGPDDPLLQAATQESPDTSSRPMSGLLSHVSRALSGTPPPSPKSTSDVTPVVDHAPSEESELSTKVIGMIVPYIVQPPREPPQPLARTISKISPYIIQPPREPPQALPKAVSRIIPHIIQPPREPPAPFRKMISRVAITHDQTPIDRPLSAPKAPASPIPPTTNAQTNGVFMSTRSNPCRFTPPVLREDSFSGKVFVVANGASIVGQALVRAFHEVGARVVFGDTNASAAKQFIAALGPPHVVHFNRCDMREYDDILDLFKLAQSMYGRVDHAVFGIGDDGGQAGPIAQSEKAWFDFENKAPKTILDEVQSNQSGEVEGTIAAGTRFARIAVAYLRYTPHQSKSSYPKRQPEESDAVYSRRVKDRSLTFVTSVAGFKQMPGLPIYQASQHAIFGLVRSLSAALEPEVDGLRVNAVATNMMVARMIAQRDGRMTVSIPTDNPEYVTKVVAGVVAGTPDEHGDSSFKQGLWYEDGRKQLVEQYLHGRLLYAVEGECWDVRQGLDRSEQVWLGIQPRMALADSLDGIGKGSQWILDEM